MPCKAHTNTILGLFSIGNMYVASLLPTCVLLLKSLNVDIAQLGIFSQGYPKILLDYTQVMNLCMQTMHNLVRLQNNIVYHVNE